MEIMKEIDTNQPILEDEPTELLQTLLQKQPFLRPILPKVLEFLQEHQPLVAALPKIEEIIMQYFDNVTFEQFFRNDVEENYSTLVLKIFTNLDNQTSFQTQRLIFQDSSFVAIIKNPAINHFLTLDFQSKYEV
jgi:hypothetical protein